MLLIVFAPSPPNSIPSQGPGRDDPLRTILHELDGVPQFGNEELKDARDRAITLELTNRLARVRGKDFTRD